MTRIDERTDVTAVAPFDVCGPLPSGLTVLEASAGTGKTYTIAALTVRWVAGGLPLPRLLLVTFGRMATGELRARVRDRLVLTEAALTTAALGEASAAADVDEVTALLVDAPTDELLRRRERVRRALADFDAATIATTHGFCQQVLSGIGVAGDVDRNAVLADDIADLVEEVVDDLYLRKFAHQVPPDELGIGLAREIGRAVVDQPAAIIVPGAADVPAGALAATRARLAGAVRDELERRKRSLRILTYDDLLTRLEAALRDPAAARRLGRRFDVVMVDEFQDTDPVQWDVLRRAFVEVPGSTLVLIGDPKQAIYAFRGADVHTYLDAVGKAGAVATLDRNWRSDGPLVTAYDELFAGMALGHPDIRYRPVRAAAANERPRLRDAPSDAALRVRLVERDDGHVELTRQGWAMAASARREVAADVAADIVELLSSKAALVTRDAGGDDTDARPVGPGDVAVLVPTHREMTAVREALDAAGVPAVVAGSRSVFGAPVARDWLVLLEALERPTSRPRVRAAAMSVFLGWSAARVATAGEAEWDAVHVRLHEWAALLRRRGVAALAEAISQAEGLPARVLAGDDGERALTDLRHIGELLHHEQTAERLGVAALTKWLRARIADAPGDLDEERSRRLDADADAVQVLTIHRCKGLEFPFVYVPYLWLPPYIPDDPLPVFADPSRGNRRTIDVGGPSAPGHEAHKAAHVAEVLGETLRLAYVALTRARQQTVVHWATTFDSRESALARILFAGDLAPGAVRLDRSPGERAVERRVAELASLVSSDRQQAGRRAASGTQPPGVAVIAVERADGSRLTRWTPPEQARPALAVRPFTRGFDGAWRRASYSSLTALAHDAATVVDRVTSESDTSALEDEPDSPGAAIVAVEAAGSPVPLAAMTAGARTGTLVHSVLEHVDFTAPDLPAEVARALQSATAWSAGGIGPAESVIDGLVAAIETPLGPGANELRLCDVARVDRLDELTFDLPVAGGDRPCGVVSTAALADLLDAHLPAGDVLAGYATNLRDPLLATELRGYLTGSIDLVLRAGSRFTVVDYKTNWLGTQGAPLTVEDYRPSRLTEAMIHAHYPLQALLYLVALHRYLRWRLPGYDPATNLAGARYLFLRGMVGAGTPVLEGARCGVFTWRPPAALVVAASDVLDQGAR
ncbi:MAG: UvrD-helicase domain-containing protein [Ilumatobacteraceae bacterium]